MEKIKLSASAPANFATKPTIKLSTMNIQSTHDRHLPIFFSGETRQVLTLLRRSNICSALAEHSFATVDFVSRQHDHFQ